MGPQRCGAVPDAARTAGLAPSSPPSGRAGTGGPCADARSLVAVRPC